VNIEPVDEVYRGSNDPFIFHVIYFRTIAFESLRYLDMKKSSDWTETVKFENTDKFKYTLWRRCENTEDP